MSMNISRPENACDLSVQSTVSALHIPATSTFIPFHQFSLTDGSTLRNPSDDNNNKTAVPVVSVVAAVTGLCPTISVVSMQQAKQLAPTVVAPTIIPAVVAPIAVQTTNCLAPTTTMALPNTISINNHISVQNCQQQSFATSGIPMHTQTNDLLNNRMSNNSSINTNKNTQLSGIKPPTTSNHGTIKSSPTLSSSNKTSAKSIHTTNSNLTTKNTSANSKTSNPPSTQGSVADQNDELVKPLYRDGELVLEVECGQNKAILYLSKLCQGSKGPCISFQSSWLTPNEFQFVSGRETAKDWKRSIRHHGKSLKLLLAKGILNVHPTMCDCDGCRQGATLTRKGEKRRIPNGERKSRKSTSNGSHSNSMDGNSFRVTGTSPMAAQLGPPGNTPVKPELKRSSGDRAMMSEVVAQSVQAERNNPTHGESNKLPLVQRPDTLNTSKAVFSKAVSAPSSPLLPGATAANMSPTITAQLNATPVFKSASAVTSSSAPSTPSLLQPFPQAVLSPRANSGSINSIPADSSFPQASMATALVVSDQELSKEDLISIDKTVLPMKPSLSSRTQEHPSILSDANGYTSITNNPINNSINYLPGSERSDQDNINTGNERYKPYNPNHKIDELNNEIDEKHSDSESSDQKDSIPPDQSIVSASKVSNNQEAETIHLDLKLSDFVSVNNIGISLSEENQGRMTQPEVLASSLEIHKDGPLSQSETSSSSASSSAATTLSVLSLSDTCSTSFSLSTSTTNAKTEHIWVPPIFSLASDDHSHMQHGSISAGPPNTRTTEQGYDSSRDNQNKHSNKGSEEFNTSGDNEGLISINFHGPAFVKPESLVSDKSPTSKECHPMDRHLTLKTEGRDSEDCHKGYTSSGRTDARHLGASNDRRDREKEERHRLKVKEERIKQEKEERHRKDREREDKRDKERRDEKEVERLRQEEKERKSQMESKTNKERTAVTPSSDPTRRPTGGVAEAAAFSDYMRVLAASQGHAFMPPTLGYMSSLFPMRPHESALPSHVLHQLNPFSPQLSGMYKDSLMYHTTGGVLPNFRGPSFGPLHPLLQSTQYATQQSLLDYQRSLAALSSYQWSGASPFFLHEMAAPSSTSTPSATTATSGGGKRPSSELEATIEMNAKKMRLEGRSPEYSSTFDYFAAAAAASQQLRITAALPSLPCGMESASMDKTAEYLRRQYLEYGSQAATYMSAFPEYVRPAYNCACADHREEDIRLWNVEDVCKFLNTLDGCAAYVEHFRKQRVNGRLLSMLTTNSLVKSMGMKLGPAVQLSEAVAKKLQDAGKLSNCDACRSIALSHTAHPMVLPL